MKMKGLIILMGFLCAQAAYANIIVKSSRIGAADICSQLPGTWSGSGTVKAGIITCKYHGTATITPGSDTKTFNMNVTLERESGICPAQETLQLPGSCDNGNIKLQTDDANLGGSINSAGTSADLSGTVSFTVLGSRVTADVDDMDLQKQ